MSSERVRAFRIDDLDRPLHRIFPVWHLEQLCRLKHLTLVKPSLWIDPREDPCSTFALTPLLGSPKKEQQPLAHYLADCWAQCWSYEANSDVLLRAYSRVILDPIIKRNTTPAEEGVRVTTTARKLMAAMEGWAERQSDCHFYIAGVHYEPEEQFGRSLAARLAGPEGPKYFSTPDGRAESLCTKRLRFSHESEVRIVCVGSGKLGSGDKIRQFPVDPDALFTDVTFDPRLVKFEQMERVKTIRAEGYSGPVSDDISNMSVLSTIALNDWPEPEAVDEIP